MFNSLILYVMIFKNVFFALSMAWFVSCSDSSEIDPVLTYGEYELSCVESETKKAMADTLYLSALAGVTNYEVTVRRQVLTDGAFNGKYEYVRPSSVKVSTANDLFTVGVNPDADGQVTCFSLTATENSDYFNPVLSSVSIAVSGTFFSMPVKQEKAELVIDSDYHILHPDHDASVVYLDNKGDIVDFPCALASSFYVNGKKSNEVWCNEECAFSYEMEENEWIKVLDCTPDKNTAGLYVLRIESVRDIENGDHPAELKLSFTLNGKNYEKNVRLLSTEVYHVGIK